MLYQNPKLKTLRQTLRNQLTDAERKLWQALRRKQLGYKFVRQYSADKYILDFYCSKLRLAIELDGSQHLMADKQKYDAKRTKFLNEQNIPVLRFLDNEVLKNIEGIIEKIVETINNIPS